MRGEFEYDVVVYYSVRTAAPPEMGSAANFDSRLGEDLRVSEFRRPLSRDAVATLLLWQDGETPPKELRELLGWKN